MGSSVAGSGPGISCSVSPPRSAGRLTPAQEQHKSATFTKFARMLHVLCLVLVLVRLPERKSVTKQSVDRGLVIIIIMQNNICFVSFHVKVHYRGWCVLRG